MTYLIVFKTNKKIHKSNNIRKEHRLYNLFCAVLQIRTQQRVSSGGYLSVFSVYLQKLNASLFFIINRLAKIINQCRYYFSCLKNIVKASFQHANNNENILFIPFRLSRILFLKIIATKYCKRHLNQHDANKLRYTCYNSMRA